MDGKDFSDIWKFVGTLIIIVLVLLPILYATMQFGNKGKASMTNTSTQTQSVINHSSANPTVDETGIPAN